MRPTCDSLDITPAKATETNEKSPTSGDELNQWASVNAPQLIAAQDNVYEDFDRMAEDAWEWDIRYEQTMGGAFSGRRSQVILSTLQLGRVQWSPGILEHGAAPHGNLVVALPLSTDGTLYLRGRPVSPGQALVVPAGEEIMLAANGRTDLMVAAIHTTLVEQWMQTRRGVECIQKGQLQNSSQVTAGHNSERATVLSDTLPLLINKFGDPSHGFLVAARALILDTALGAIPSFETIEPLHRRAKVATAMRALLHENLEYPLTITDLCRIMAVRERTLYLACQEAFGKPPKRLLQELRLNAARRHLTQPSTETDVTSVALCFGFLHLGRFALDYRDLFGESPSVTLARSRFERQPGRQSRGPYASRT